MKRAALLLVALALAGCGGDDSNQAASTTAAAADGVEELGNVLDLRADFEADEGKTRVVILFSPT